MADVDLGYDQKSRKKTKYLSEAKGTSYSTVFFLTKGQELAQLTIRIDWSTLATSVTKHPEENWIWNHASLN